jgi:large subunit ribosomal protein L6
MSRIGKMPIIIPKGVEIKINGNTVIVKGPKGELKQDVHPSIKVEIDEGKVIVNRGDDQKQSKAYHGLYRSLINNMIEGVSKGFKITLKINGVGYKAEKNGNTMVLSLGYSHPINYEMPNGISFTLDKPGTTIDLEGIDKQLIGQVASKIRGFRKPEPYKGKGVKYADEILIRKEGKTK